MAIDEHGVVRSVRPDLKTFEAEFLNKQFPPGNARLPGGVGKAKRPDLVALRRRAEQLGSPVAWRELGDAVVLWGGLANIDDAIDAYRRVLRIRPKDGDAHFRLGVCHRMRYESPRQLPTDFQTAVNHWSEARSIQPNQYIWRRRVEQYGPRLGKPYPFYDWVETAAREIRARGDQPVELNVLPTGAEVAQPAGQFTADARTPEPPDPEGRILRDTQELIVVEAAVVPPKVKPGETARVHVILRPNVGRKAHWNNEAEPLRLWIDPPRGWQVDRHLLVAPQGKKPETSEVRRLEFEVRVAEDTRGTIKLNVYALYYVCEGVQGTCKFLRQDIAIPMEVDGS